MKDVPKTYGVIVYCPITLDAEIGPYKFNLEMTPGGVCRALSEYPVKITIALRQSQFVINSTFYEDLNVTHPKNSNEIRSILYSNPVAARHLHILNEHNTSKAEKTNKLSRRTHTLIHQHEIEVRNYVEVRQHAVCAVQTFRNPLSGTLNNEVFSH